MWNGRSTLKVRVPLSYQSELCGLCGDFDEIKANDWTLGPDGICVDQNSNAPGSQVGYIFSSI